MKRGFPDGSVGQESGVVTAVVQVQSMAWELLHARGAAKKEIGMNKVSKSLS